MKSKLRVHILLDRSGSMQPSIDATIEAVNGYMAKLGTDEPDAILSLTMFDSMRVETIYNGKAKDAVPLSRKSYVPQASTPLYDAAAEAIDLLDKDKSDDKVLVIMTDGQENASRKATAAEVRDRLDQRQRDEGWLVIFLGANQDAFTEGAKLGTQAGSTMSFNMASVGATMDVAYASTARYAAAGTKAEKLLRSQFTSEERAKAAGDKK